MSSTDMNASDNTLPEVPDSLTIFGTREVMRALQGPGSPQLSSENDFSRWNANLLLQLITNAPEIHDYLVRDAVFNPVIQASMDNAVTSFMLATIEPHISRTATRLSYRGKLLYQYVCGEYSKLSPETRGEIWFKTYCLFQSATSVLDVLDYFQNLDPRIVDTDSIPQHLRAFGRKFPSITGAFDFLDRRGIVPTWDRLEHQIRTVVASLPPTTVSNVAHRKRSLCRHCGKRGHHPNKCWNKKGGAKERSDSQEKAAPNSEKRHQFILDSGATVSLVNSISYIHDFVASKDVTPVKGISGQLEIQGTGHLVFQISGEPIKVPVAYAPKVPINLISFHQLLIIVKKQLGLSMTIDVDHVKAASQIIASTWSNQCSSLFGLEITPQRANWHSLAMLSTPDIDSHVLLAHPDNMLS